MTPGIFTTVFPRESIEATLDAIAAHGITAVQMDFESGGLGPLPLGIPAGLPERIGAAARDRGIEIAALSGTFNMAHPDAAVREDGLARLASVIAAARPMGTGVVTLCTGTRDRESMWRRHPDNDTPAAWADLRETLDRALEPADRHGVTLAVECEPANVIRDARAGRRLLDEVGSEWLGIAMDPANILAGDLSRDPHDLLDEAFDLLGDRIVTAHAKDVDAAERFCPAGTGIVPWDHVAGLLRGAGFAGPWVMHSLAEPDVPGCVAVVRAAIGSR